MSWQLQSWHSLLTRCICICIYICPHATHVPHSLFFLSFLSFLLYFYCALSTLSHLHKFLQYILVNSPPPSFFFTPSHSWNNFSRSYFSFIIHEYIVFSLSYTLSLYPPPSHYYQWIDRNCFTFLFSIFEKKTCLFKMAPQVLSLWHFHVYMHYNSNWFMPSVFS
jgi:hypothetical protein